MLRYFCSANLWLLFSLVLILGKSDNGAYGSRRYTFFGAGSGLDNPIYNSLIFIGLAAAVACAVLAFVTRRWSIGPVEANASESRRPGGHGVDTAGGPGAAGGPQAGPPGAEIPVEAVRGEGLRKAGLWAFDGSAAKGWVACHSAMAEKFSQVLLYQDFLTALPYNLLWRQSAFTPGHRSEEDDTGVWVLTAVEGGVDCVGASGGTDRL